MSTCWSPFWEKVVLVNMGPKNDVCNDYTYFDGIRLYTSQELRHMAKNGSFGVSKTETIETIETTYMYVDMRRF